MSKENYTTAAQLPITRLAEPAARALALQFAAVCGGRFGACLVAAARRAA
jgi:hypothetical protein